MKDNGLNRVFSEVTVKDWENISENLPKEKYRVVYDVVQQIGDSRRIAVGVYNEKTLRLSIVANSELEKIALEYYSKYYTSGQRT